MYVYELALELDRRSADLVDQAAAAGFPGLTPSTDLKPDEVAELCAALGVVRGGPEAPGGPTAAPGTWGPPQFAAPALPGESPAPPPPSRYVQRRALRVAVTIIVVIVVAVGGMILRGSDDDAAACSIAGNTMCQDGELIGGGATLGPTTTAPPEATYGTRGGEPAPITDLPRFCAGQREFLLFYADLQEHLAAVDMTQGPGREDALVAWFVSQNEYPLASATAVVDSFGENLASDQAVVLQDLVVDIAAEVESSEPHVHELVGYWSGRVGPVIETLQEAGAAYC